MKLFRQAMKAEFKAINAQLGIHTIAELGRVFDGPLQTYRCEVSMSIEQWPKVYLLRIEARRYRGSSFSQARFVAWPYSAESATALADVLHDLGVVEAGLSGSGFTDRRSAFGRGVDRLLGTESLGEYRFTSVVDHDPPSVVKAELARVRGHAVVTLTQHRQRYGLSMLHLPLEAFKPMRAALRRYVESADR